MSKNSHKTSPDFYHCFRTALSCTSTFFTLLLTLIQLNKILFLRLAYFCNSSISRLSSNVCHFFLFRFIAVMHADQDGVVPGNALVVDPKKQFRPLSKFGNAFLNRFQCSNTKSDVLKGISIVDTPGILSGEKQRTDRGYDFIGVLEWFAERVDRILLLFDAHKLDISDEFKRSIEALRGHDDKIR